MSSLQDIVGDYQTFLGQILKETVGAGFDLSDFVQMDHMCYRVSTPEMYQAKKSQLTEVAALLDEVQINGRPVATFRLKVPVFHDRWRIDTLELPAPKEGVPTKDGLEHVEFVIYDDKEAFLKKNEDKTFDLRAADRGVNPEIGFKLPSYGVKFHLLSLPAVIYLQRKTGIVE